MTKMDYSRGYTSLTRESDLPKATPISRAQRAAYWAQKTQDRLKHKQVNADPEVIHATHSASVREGYGKYVLWCDECKTEIKQLTADEYKAWREINPPKVLRKKP